MSTIFYIPYSSVKEIPLEEYKNLHRQYWTFISENHLDEKPSIFSRITKLPLNICGRCFACGYAFIKDFRNIKWISYCEGCPISIYRGSDLGCINENSIVTKWINTGDHIVAAEIANLEWED